MPSSFSVGVGARLLPALLLFATRAGALSSSAADTSKPRRFYVLRHGQTDANASGVLQGSSDASRLTSLGREQVAAVGSAALCPVATTGRARRIDSVYVSPLSRARETLETLRASAPPGTLPPDGSETVLDDLREIDFYSWENRPKEDLRGRHPEEWEAWIVGDPDGLVVDGRRPLWETWDRAGRVWGEIRSLTRSATATVDGAGIDDEETATLLVCHGTLGQALLGAAFGLDATIFRRNRFPNCGMAEILWRDEDATASDWRWHYPAPTEYGCLRRQMEVSVEM